MGVADEVLAYVRTLVWPCVAAFALILFRRQVGNLIPRIWEISAVGASVRFGEQATGLADEAGRLVQGVVGGQAARELPELLGSGPAADPTVVFLEAYRELEATAKDAGPAAEVVAATPVPVIRSLASRGQVPAEAVRIAEDLRRVRTGHRRRRAFPSLPRPDRLGLRRGLSPAPRRSRRGAAHTVARMHVEICPRAGRPSRRGEAPRRAPAWAA